MLDFDNFKKLNDDFGHLVGDRVLRAIANVIKAQMRGVDTAARYGGEELALIAPGLGADDAAALGERIRAAIAANGCGVTASVGVATYPGDARGDDALVAAADAALYRSKHAGRNRVTSAGDVGVLG